LEKGGDPDKIKESQKKRYAKVELVDEVIELDQDWRKCKDLLECGAFFVTDDLFGRF
jgi:seryl-tRNA synthetase